MKHHACPIWQALIYQSPYRQSWSLLSIVNILIFTWTLRPLRGIRKPDYEVVVFNGSGYHTALFPNQCGIDYIRS